jgi:hypothetical protein
MTTTLTDLIDLALEVGPPVEAGALRLFPVFSASPAAADYLCGPEAERRCCCCWDSVSSQPLTSISSSG